MLLLRPLILASTLFALSPTSDVKQVENLLDSAAARQADTLDVVSSGGLLSHVVYEAKLPATTPSLPSPLPDLNLPPRLVRFGAIAGGAGSYRKTGNQSGGLLVDLGSANKVRNLLAYQTLNLAGTWSGSWQVAMADENQVKSKEQTILGDLSRNETIAIPLNRSVVAKTDISRARHLIFTLNSPQGKLNLRTINFNRPTVPGLPPKHAVWILNPHKLLRAPETYAEELAAKGFKRAYVQITDTPASLYPFLRATSRLGIEVYARDGAPEDLNHSVPLLTRVVEIIAYNRSYAEAPFAGLQLDIAPHDLRDFGIRRSYYIERYQTLLNDIASLCKSVMPLSLIVPHWFTSIPTNGLNLATKSLNLADELVITCDRTEFNNLVQCSREILFWGEHFAKPIFIGIKAGPVPDEGHVILKKIGKKNGKKNGNNLLTLAGIQWQRETAYTIPASTISFSSNPAGLANLLTQTPPSPAFAGWVINSFENLK